MSYVDDIISNKVGAETLAKDLAIFLRKDYPSSVAIAKQEVALMIAVKELKLELTQAGAITPGIEGLTDATKLKLNMATGGTRNIGLIQPLTKFLRYAPGGAFGYRKRQDKKTGVWYDGMHFGVDINSTTSAALVVAAAEGQVIHVGGWGGGGNTVMIYHSTGSAQGHTTVYMHLSSISVKKHQVVKQGQIIGREGSTGWSTGPHLHFEVQIGQGPQNSSGSPSAQALSLISYTPTPTYLHGKGYSKVIAAQDPRLYLP